MKMDVRTLQNYKALADMIPELSDLVDTGIEFYGNSHVSNIESTNNSGTLKTQPHFRGISMRWLRIIRKHPKIKIGKILPKLKVKIKVCQHWHKMKNQENYQDTVSPNKPRQNFAEASEKSVPILARTE